MDSGPSTVQNANDQVAKKDESRNNQPWTMFIYGSSTRDGSEVGIVLKSPEGSVIEQSVRLGFAASNNESEYEALIVGMKKAKILGVRNLLIHCDSQLVANQLTGEYAAGNQRMEVYIRLAHRLFREFKLAYIEKFPRTSNSHANALATLASAVDSNLK